MDDKAKKNKIDKTIKNNTKKKNKNSKKTTKEEKVEKVEINNKYSIKDIKTTIDNIKKDPMDYIKYLLISFKQFVLNNKLFFIFLLFAVLDDFLLRFLTANENNSAFKIDPVLADFAFACFVGSFSFLMKKRKFGYLLFWIIFFSVICMINSIYYTYYTSFSSISSLSTLKFITSVGDAVVENVFSPKDLIYLLFPIIFIYIHRHYKKNNYLLENDFFNKSYKKFIQFFAISGVVAAIFCSSLSGTDVSRLVKQWNREYIVMKYGAYVYHVNDAIKSMEPKLASLFGYDNALKEFNEYYDAKTRSSSNSHTNIFEGKNLLVIHWESVQNFVVDLKINGEEVTPNLNKLINKSMYFDNFYTQVSVGTSSDTEFTFNTSLMPANYGTAFGNYFDKEYVSTPSLLKEKGYYNFAMHGNNGDFWNRRIMHKNLGYDDLYAKDTYNIDDVIGLGISDVSFFTQSVDKIKKIDSEHENYYGTIITLTNHTPFFFFFKYDDFPVSLKENETNPVTGMVEEKEYPYLEGTKLGNYLKSVHYADYALGIFLDLMEQNNLFDNTVLLIYGDHDARLPKADYIKMYNYNKETDEVLNKEDPNYIEFGEYEYEINRRTPLVIYSKDRENSPERYSYPMAMIDCLPTLGNMFGFYNQYALGHDIFDIKDNNIIVFPTGNWLTKEMYYNAQKNESYMLTNAVIEEGYITNNSDYADNLLDVSNDILIYDLIRNSRIKSSKVDENKIIGEVK